jgi:glyoxylase-like metal-dependent hydrolase (beta-lactamase superfamily II)
MIEVTRHDDVTRLRGTTRGSRALNYEVSAYLVRGVLVDTGCPGLAPDLTRWLDDARLQGALVTHYHEDHAGNVPALVARGIPVGMAPQTLARIRRPAPIGFYRRLCWGAAAGLTRDPEPFSHPALALLHAPGHTSDHHVVWDAERETVFGGDLFIGVKVRIAHPGEDVRGQSAVLRRIAAPCGGAAREGAVDRRGGGRDRTAARRGLGRARDRTRRPRRGRPHGLVQSRGLCQAQPGRERDRGARGGFP